MSQAEKNAKMLEMGLDFVTSGKAGKVYAKKYGVSLNSVYRWGNIARNLEEGRAPSRKLRKTSNKTTKLKIEKHSELLELKTENQQLRNIIVDQMLQLENYKIKSS